MTNFFDDLPPYVPSPPPYAATSATARTKVIDLSRQQFPTNNEPFIPNSPFNDHDDHPLPSFKRIRISSSESTNYHHSNAALPAVPFPPQRMMMMPPPPPPPPHNNNNNNKGGGGSGSGTSHIFFKTRLCAKFRHGSCRNGENCNFAHGTEDMRQPPPNWQEIVGLRGGSSKNEERPAVNWDQDQKIIHKMKLCKKYYNGEQCPYGEKCSFLHEDPAKFRDDSGRIRASSAISIGTNGSPKSHRDGSNNNTDNNAETYAVNMGLDAARGNVRSTFWKTKLCIKWKTTGDCPFGQDCHFAHGESELNVPGGCVEVEAATGLIPISTYSTVPTLRKVPSIPVINDVAAAPPGRIIPSPPLATNEVEPSKKSLVKKWKWPKKMNGIYGDWLEDMPLDEHDVPSGMDKDT